MCTPETSRKKSKDAEVPDAGVSFRWQPDEETLLAKCYVAISEERNAERLQAKDTFWYRVLNEFNRFNFQKRTKDMLSSKWNTMNHNFQKFNAIYKRCSHLTKSGESELDVMKQARAAYRDENKNTPQEEAWELLQLRLKREAAFEVAKEKDCTVMRLEEMKFLAISTKDLPEDDAYFIEEQKEAIRAKYNLYRNRGSNPGDANNDDARTSAYKVDNMVRKPKPWAYGNRPLSLRELQQMRNEFWHNAIRAGGRREIWEALRAATEGNLLNAQKIIEDKNIRLGNQDMSVCYDDNGTRYNLPLYVLSEPTNMEHRVLNVRKKCLR
nr:hypothetical protein [Tanacetum cinerariifolium]